MGVRQEGVTLVDDVGGGGGGPTQVDIVAPLGQALSTASIPVVIASDQSPIDVNAVLTLPTGQEPMADSLPVVIASDQSPVPVTGSLALLQEDLDAFVAGTTKAAPVQGVFNDGLANVASGESAVPRITNQRALHSNLRDSAGNEIISGTIGSSITGSNRALNTKAVLYLRNTDSSIGAWQGEAGYATFASGNYPWAKVMRSSHLQTEITLDLLDEQLSLDIRERSLEAVAVYTRLSNLIGTIKFLTTPGDSGFATEVYDTRQRKWITGEIVNPVADTLYFVPCAGLQSIQVRITAYTSGSIAVSAAGGPGVIASYANVSGSTVEVSNTDLDIRDLAFATDKVDVSGSTVDTELPAAAALADNVSNPTVPGVGAFGMVFDGATWDRWEGTVKANYPITGVNGPFLIDALNEQAGTSPTDAGYNSLTITISTAGFTGTLELFVEPAGVTSPIYFFDVQASKWINEITNLGLALQLVYTVPIFNGHSIYLRCTAYTSGDVAVSFSGNHNDAAQNNLTNAELRENPLEIDVLSSALPTGAATEATLLRINTQGQKAMAASTPVVIASDQSPVNIEVEPRTVLFRGRACSFNTPGRAGTAGQKILSLHNATGSAIIVRVSKVFVDLNQTVVKAVTVPPPIVRVWKVTVLPTNGTDLTKNKIGGSTTSNASVTVKGDASADGTGSGTTLTATLPAGTFISQEFAARLITGAGYEAADRLEFLFDELVQLNALEGLVVFLDYTAATQNPTTDRWLAGIEWTEE